MTPGLIIAVVAFLAMIGFVGFRLYQLPAKLAARGLEMQALTGQVSTTVPLAQQPSTCPWVAGTVGPTAVTCDVAPGYYDPTKVTVPQTFNEFGFLTSPLPAPVNPKTNAVPLTNIDICNWFGHVPGSNPCTRCGTSNP